MPGQIYFGNNGDTAGCSISDELAHFLLGIETAVAMGEMGADFVFLPIPGGGGKLLPPGADAGQTRVFPDFQPPAGAIGQVKMQTVEVQCLHAVLQLFQDSLLKEMARNIHMQAAPGDG